VLLMVKIPDALYTVFTGTLEEADDSYYIEVPASEVDAGALTPGVTHRVAILNQDGQTAGPTHSEHPVRQDGPPVSEGDIREVTISAVGEQGDGIAKIEHGYVVIVPDTTPGEQPTVEIEHVQPNVAFATVAEPESEA
jgi:predicted RNA-binding protein with TRAM domain